MRRAVAALLLVWLVAACAPAHRSAEPGADGATRERAGSLVHVTLLQVNDLYELEPVGGGRRGGVARLATLVKAVKRENPNTVFVLAGDFISPSVMSTLLRGEQMVAAMNAAGLDLATFGNHEFDFGPDVLAVRMRESTFQWLSSNVVDRATGRPIGTARPDLLTSLGGVAIGFFGLTMPETAATSSPGRDVVFRDTATAAREAIAGLRGRGATLVVGVTHQAMADDRALAEAGGVDVILGGHEHDPLVAEQGAALITKAGSAGRYLVRVDLWMKPSGEIVERSWQFREVTARVAPDPAVEAVVARYAERLDRVLDVVIGRAEVPLEARRAPLRTEETNVGNFVTDLMRARMGSDVAVLNGGGIRGDRVIPAGPLTRREVVALLPFINVVVKLEMTGRDLRRALEHGLAQTDRQGGGFLQLSGARIAWDPGRPAGSRMIRAEVGGAPLDDGRTYTVAVNDYLSRGGDGFAAFRGAKVLVDEHSGPALTTMVVDAVTAAGAVAPHVEGRITRVGAGR
jgi:2',3'-cyclic-nucleotide 2'-phosphodiesterase (5'-nucleotidase family)